MLTTTIYKIKNHAIWVVPEEVALITPWKSPGGIPGVQIILKSGTSFTRQINASLIDREEEWQTEVNRLWALVVGAIVAFSDDNSYRFLNWKVENEDNE